VEQAPAFRVLAASGEDVVSGAMSECIICLLLAEAHQAGMGVIVEEALANGRLTERNADPAFALQRRHLDDVATNLGVTVDALALAAALAQAWADTVLSGATTPEQLQSNLAALRVPWGEGSGERLRAIAETPEVYWATRARLPWN
jgi:aryl-alcohol dehydrogenase-like predicted oxidoreductase